MEHLVFRAFVISIFDGKSIQIRNILTCSENVENGVGLNDRISGGSRISPRRGRQLPRGAPTYDFATFSQKLHEIERIWTSRGGRASLTPPLDPPLRMTHHQIQLYGYSRFTLMQFVFGVKDPDLELLNFRLCNCYFCFPD